MLTVNRPTRQQAVYQIWANVLGKPPFWQYRHCYLTSTRVRTDPGKSWNLNVEIFRPGKSWKKA